MDIAILTKRQDSLPSQRLTHLQRLEAESIHILREVAAEVERPVMLYSIGKDSTAMLHVAQKAFYPAKPPFPLLHVDTTWKFREMIAFRDARARELGLVEQTNLVLSTRRQRCQRRSDARTTTPSDPAVRHHGATEAPRRTYGHHQRRSAPVHQERFGIGRAAGDHTSRRALWTFRRHWGRPTLPSFRLGPSWRTALPGPSRGPQLPAHSSMSAMNANNHRNGNHHEQQRQCHGNLRIHFTLQIDLQRKGTGHPGQ